jgi:hypothetical protein
LKRVWLDFPHFLCNWWRLWPHIGNKWEQRRNSVTSYLTRAWRFALIHGLNWSFGHYRLLTSFRWKDIVAHLSTSGW